MREAARAQLCLMNLWVFAGRVATESCSAQRRCRMESFPTARYPDNRRRLPQELFKETWAVVDAKNLGRDAQATSADNSHDRWLGRLVRVAR